MVWLQVSKKTYAFSLLIILALVVCGCSRTTGTSESERTSLKPQLELVCEKSLGNVAQDQIPDVTAQRWSFGLQPTKPVVSPDGKHVLVVGEGKMTLYDTSSGVQKWEKSTYGGIDSYIIGNDRLYLAEKYAYERDKEHGYIICMDIDTGNELWKYDVQADLAPVVEKYKPEEAKFEISCSLNITTFNDKIYAVGSTTWSVGKDKDKGEVLLCLNRNGKKLWKTESHGYPGLISMSDMKVINGKLVMGNYSYGEDINGPACVHAFDIKTGKKVWKFDIHNDPELADSKGTNVAVGVVQDKVVAVANFGKIYLLDSDGHKTNEFIAFRPEKYQDTTICTSVFNSGLGFSKDEIIIAPTKSVVKGAGSYYAKAPVEHPDAGSVMVFDLNGSLKWKFRLGGQASSMLVKGKYLLLGTMHNQDTMDYSYCGVYAFDLAQEAKKTELNMEEKNVLDRYIGYYQTDGAIIYDCLGASEDGRVICATTWPTRVGTEKHGEHSLYILRIK